MIAHITLIIAHHHPVFLSILHNILQSCAGICVLAKVSTAEGLLKKTRELKPDVVLVAQSLPGMADDAAWQKLVAQLENTKVVVSWQHPYSGKIPALMQLSCAGYVAGDAPPVEYIYAVKQAAKGKESFCTQTQKLRASPNKATFAKKPDGTWLQLIYCITMGYSIKDTADATKLKENTVKSYRKKLKSETGYRSMEGLERIVNG